MSHDEHRARHDACVATHAQQTPEAFRRSLAQLGPEAQAELWERVARGEAWLAAQAAKKARER